MKKTVIIGRPNAGKTLFMINFAEYLGLNRLYLKQEFPDGKIFNKEMSIDTARRNLSSKDEFKTQCIQGIDINIPIYKGKKQVRLLDTSGLNDGIHPNMRARNSIIQTLEKIKEGDVILHIVDISVLLDRNIISQIDRQIISFGMNRRGYVILPNKIDLDKNKLAFNRLREEYPKTFMIPISAKYKDGFDEVKSFVIRCI